MKFYTSCETLPLKNFFKIIEENDFKYLVITDNYDFKLRRDVSELWEQITNEYSQIAGNDDVMSGFNIYREIHQLVFTYEIMQAMIFSLHYRYNKEYIDDLAMFGYKVDIVDNIITLESLNRCSQMSRAILNDIDELKNSVKSKSKPDKNNFYNILAWLIKGYGNLDENISVSKFIALKKLLNSTISKENGRNKR